MVFVELNWQARSCFSAHPSRRRRPQRQAHFLAVRQHPYCIRYFYSTFSVSSLYHSSTATCSPYRPAVRTALLRIFSILSFLFGYNLLWLPLLARQDKGREAQMLPGTRPHRPRIPRSHMLLVVPPGLALGRPLLFLPQRPRLALTLRRPRPSRAPSPPSRSPTAHGLTIPGTASSRPSPALPCVILPAMYLFYSDINLRGLLSL